LGAARKGRRHIKARNDWVSRADRESEKAIASFLHDLFPRDAILGEESGISVTGAVNGRSWITEPLDGKRVSTRRKRDRVA
jgi:myo-inositol-1(or 4)-monophosphatase